MKWQATHVQPGFGVRSELGKHARTNCAADSRYAGAARSGITTLPLREAHDPDRPTAVLRPTLRAETTLTWRCELRAAASTWLRRARAFACLACASRGWPGSIPKASSDLRSGQGARAPTAVLGLRRGARGGELRRESCKRNSIVHEGSQILRNLPTVFLFPRTLCGVSVCLFLRSVCRVLCFKGTAVYRFPFEERAARPSHSPRTQRWQHRDC